MWGKYRVTRVNTEKCGGSLDWSGEDDVVRAVGENSEQCGKVTNKVFYNTVIIAVVVVKEQEKKLNLWDDSINTFTHNSLFLLLLRLPVPSPSTTSTTNHHHHPPPPPLPPIPRLLCIPDPALPRLQALQFSSNLNYTFPSPTHAHSHLTPPLSAWLIASLVGWLAGWLTSSINGLR